MKPAAAIRMGPGGAALVGLMGRPDIGVVQAAARRIERRAPRQQLPDLLAALRMLSEGRYTARELERIVPEEVAMSSTLFARVRKRSRAEGRAEGLAEGARAVCLGLVKQHHPSRLPVLAPLVEACADVALLQEWALAASRLSDDELVELLRSDTSREDRPAQRRAPRPARRSGRPKRR